MSVVGFVIAAALLLAAPAAATPVATSDEEYDALGRVFPDPLAGCTTEPCSPNAQGNIPATQFIQYLELLDAIEYMNQKPEWQPYMEVQVLDGELGANGEDEGDAGDALDVGDPGAEVFPGNDLPLEYDPKREYRSAGLPTTTLGREKSDIVVLRVTDESVPDAGKERYALSLSIHGIERAGVEGGTRAAEDLVTAFTTGRDQEPVVPADPDDPESAPGPTFAEVLRESIVYFTYPNPDGWRRGSVFDDELGPGVFFQRYNGNGVDLNRDWPDIGYSFRPYSGLSEPESRALAAYLDDVKSSTGDDFAAGDDLHGQPFADALSYTLLPHGRHDFEKDQRIRQTVVGIHRASEQALLWSPIIKPNEEDGVPQSNPNCLEGPLGATCPQIYGQTWGTVYDTINYTTTGALGDYFDSSVGLGADGIDNEMSFSHLDKNIVFDPHTEQLHVDGNKALIYAHLAELLNPRIYRFEPAGTQGYVPNLRLTREEQEAEPPPPPGTVAQTDISGQLGSPAPDPPIGATEFPFTVKQGPQRNDGSPDGGRDIYNGGLRVDITKGNAQGIGDGGLTALKVQCRGCDRHVGVEEDDEWVTVAEDYNQSPLYLQSGLTAAVNFPDAYKPDGTLVEWRARIDGVQAAEMSVDFTSGPATTSGATGGDEPPVLAGYDIANTDFFGDLDGFIEDPVRRFQEVDPRAVIEEEESLTGLRSLVLADDPLPGYTGPYEGEQPAPSGPPTADQEFEMQQSTVPGQGPEGCARTAATAERYEFEIGPDDGNESLMATVMWGNPANDYDLFLLRREGSQEQEVGNSQDFNLLTGQARETIEVSRPRDGDYIVEVVNCTVAPSSDADPWTGTVTFEPLEATGESAYTTAEKDAWFEALSDYVEGGGNLVLTDGSLRALPELTSVPADAITKRTVYVGQTTFATGDGEGETTLEDPLAENIDQEGARFNSGMRRQTYEPTPLGFAIQSEGGADQSNARQYDVDRAAWEQAGGRTAGTSADSGERDAAPLYDRVTLGELALGDGQIRIAGALLPQPTQRFDHEFGLEPYATTYTGYILVCNLLDCTVRSEEVPGDGEPPPGDGDPPSGDGGPGGGGPDGGGPDGGGPGGDDGDRPCSNRIGGTNGRDKLAGTSGSDRITGKRGGDRIKGKRGDDCLLGKGGRDKIKGGGGDDEIRGGGGGEKLKGGGGSDEVRGGKGKDRIKAGGGNDVVRAARGGRDRIDCGPGRDKAFINAGKDRTRRCEKVKVR